MGRDGTTGMLSYSIDSVYSMPKNYANWEIVPGLQWNKVQLAANNSREAEIDRSRKEWIEIFSSHHHRAEAKERWCGTLPSSPALRQQWQSGHNGSMLKSAKLKLIEKGLAWEKLLPHVTHKWVGSRTGEQIVAAKSRCEFHWPSGNRMLCFSNFISSLCILRIVLLSHYWPSTLWCDNRNI